MSSIDRPLPGDVLCFHLADERALVNDAALLERHGRNARTLLKEGPLRVTLVTLRVGGQIATHRSSGPMTVHLLDGDIQLHAAGQEHRLPSGDLLVTVAELEHTVISEGGGTLPLTFVQA